MPDAHDFNFLCVHLLSLLQFPRKTDFHYWDLSGFLKAPLKQQVALIVSKETSVLSQQYFFTFKASFVTF